MARRRSSGGGSGLGCIGGLLVLGLIGLVITYWYIALIIAVVIVVIVIAVKANKKKNWNRQYSEKSAEGKVISKAVIDNMEGHKFEYFCSNILRMNGFVNVRVTQGSGDQGVDILATFNGVDYAIQIKRYAGNVGNASVQAVFAGAKYYGSSKPVVLTNNYFTPSARQLASKIGVELWNRDRLFGFISSAGYLVVD